MRLELIWPSCEIVWMILQNNITGSQAMSSGMNYGRVHPAWTIQRNPNWNAPQGLPTSASHHKLYSEVLNQTVNSDFSNLKRRLRGMSRGGISHALQH